MPYIVKDKINFLSEASKILSSTLDYNVTMAVIAKLVVNYVADFCIIDILENQGMRRVAVNTSDTKQRSLVRKMFLFPPDPKNKHAIYDTATSGKPILIKKVNNNWLKTVSKIPEERRIVEVLKLKTLMFAPLKSRGKVIGVLTIASNIPGFSYSEDDAIFIQELAVRAGTAVDKARLYTEAQEALRLRDEFLSIASHELKTPLTSILLNLQYVLHKINRAGSKKINAHEISEMLEVSRKQSKRMVRLIDDLSNISLISTGKLQLEKEPVELSHLLKDVIHRFEPVLKKEKIKLSLKKPLHVQGEWDKIRLEQVFSNLISNAIKYGNKKPITVTMEKDSKNICIKVIDQGIGIKKNEQKEIFGRFIRTESAKKFSGLGVGLYISHQIVEAHGGNLSVESREGQGSTFSVYLPL